MDVTTLTRASLTRRQLLRRGTAGLAALAAGACGFLPSGDREEQGAELGHLKARPGTPAGQAAPGLAPLGLSAGRDGVLYVPAGYRADHAAPLVLMLHGAGGAGSSVVNLLRGLADDAGLLLLAPDSRAGTWDAVLAGFGPDVGFVDRALARTFARCAVDPARVAVAGFSDGATYALSLGLTTGDLFRRVVAWSPGFMVPATLRGKPPVFISHGTEDAILPIDRCSRRIVPALRDAGYAVDYREFAGGHQVPQEMREAAVSWLAEDNGLG